MGLPEIRVPGTLKVLQTAPLPVLSHLDIPQASKTWHVQGQIHLLPTLLFPILVGITQSPKLEVILGFLISSKTPHIPPLNQLPHPIGFIY